MSWTGSEHQRREQGGCAAPSPLTTYRIRANSPCYVRKMGGAWKPYYTMLASTFEDYSERKGNRYVFRNGDYEIEIQERYVDKQHGY